MNSFASPVLLTGAAGKLGRVLARALAERGWRVRLTDNTPFPDPLPANAQFHQADLSDEEAMRDLAGGCRAIIHFGAVSKPTDAFDQVLDPNIRGLHNIYEAARRQGARVVFASSHHAVGFYERRTTLDHDCAFRPDGFYGLSKAYGELMGRLYWDQHGVESVNIRIGACVPEPRNARMMSIWLSHDDLVACVERSVLADCTGYSIVWGVSNNSKSWWRKDDRERLGWAPQDSADVFADRFPKAAHDAEEPYQGGAFLRPAPLQDVLGK